MPQTNIGGLIILSMPFFPPSRVLFSKSYTPHFFPSKITRRYRYHRKSYSFKNHRKLQEKLQVEKWLKKKKIAIKMEHSIWISNRQNISSCCYRWKHSCFHLYNENPLNKYEVQYICVHSCSKWPFIFLVDFQLIYYHSEKH